MTVPQPIQDQGRQRALAPLILAQRVYDVTVRFGSVRTCPRFQSGDLSPHSTDAGDTTRHE